MKHDLKLTGCRLINGQGEVSEKSNLYITNGCISAISACSSVDEQEAVEQVECDTLFVTPGLVNLHAHSPMNVFKGLAEDVSINDWFNKEIFPYESKMNGDDVYHGSLLAIAEMLENGVTAFADHYFFGERICEAVVDSGIKADIAPTIFGFDDGYRSQLALVSHQISSMSKLNPRLKLRMGPHSPYLCTPSILREIIEEAKTLGVGIHLHVSETQKQVEDSIAAHGKTPFQVLNDAGGFEVSTIVAHGLWIQPQDIELLGERTWIAACPKTYMKLAMGTGNLWRFHQQLKLCIGTDGAASSNTLNPLEQARLFALVGKLIDNDAESYRLKDIWKILFRGHEALGFDSGRLEVGAPADLAVWRLEDVNTSPGYNPLAAILYSAGVNNVIHTIVNGQFRKRDGVLCMDKERLLANVQQVSKDILERGKQQSQIMF